MWEDMKMYWAWRGEDREGGRPPTIKTLDYADLGRMKLCIGVWDDDKYTPLNRKELAEYIGYSNTP